jgi:hypothetical protein
MFGAGKRHDADRLAAESGTRLLLDGSEEAVEVEIEAFDLCWPTVTLALAFIASPIAELLNYLLYVDAHILRGITRYVRTLHQSLFMARDQRGLRSHDALSHLEFSVALQHRADATIIRCARGEERQPRACRIEMGAYTTLAERVDGTGNSA